MYPSSINEGWCALPGRISREPLPQLISGDGEWANRSELVVTMHYSIVDRGVNVQGRWT